MSQFQRTHQLGWQENFQFNNFDPKALEVEPVAESREVGLVLSLVIAFAILVTAAGLLNFLNHTFDRSKIEPMISETRTLQTEISLIA